jgi:hypothetical protein
LLRLLLDKEGNVKGWQLMPGKYWIKVAEGEAEISPMAPSDSEGPGPGRLAYVDVPMTATGVEKGEVVWKLPSSPKASGRKGPSRPLRG